MKIDKKWLMRHKACPDAVKIFTDEWPDGAEITAANFWRAHDLRLDLSWFARCFLPAPLLAEYERQEASLLAEYERQRAPLLAEYRRQEASLLAKFERQRTPLLAEYRRQRAPLLWPFIAQAAIAAAKKEETA